MDAVAGVFKPVYLIPNVGITCLLLAKGRLYLACIKDLFDK